MSLTSSVLSDTRDSSQHLVAVTCTAKQPRTTPLPHLQHPLLGRCKRTMQSRHTGKACSVYSGALKNISSNYHASTKQHFTRRLHLLPCIYKATLYMNVTITTMHLQSNTLHEGYINHHVATGIVTTLLVCRK